MNIALITDRHTPPSVRFYRTSGVFHRLQEQIGGAINIQQIPQHQFIQNETSPFAYRMAIIERPISPGALQAVQMCKEQGVFVWLDYDDNLFDIPPYNQARDFYQGQTAETVKKCMSLADVVTTTTDFLSNLYRGFNRNVVTIPNAWNDFQFEDLPEISDVKKPIRMAWRGSNKHNGDLYAVKGVLSKQINDPAFQWAFLGHNPFFLNLHTNQYRPFSNLFGYFRSFFSSGVDYLFVPLRINNFNKSKSNCSWIEATIAGAVTIAPMGLPEFDRPGVIRYKDNKHLEQIFKKIKSGGYDKQERVEASREALEEIRLSKINAMRGNVIAQAFGMVVEEKEQQRVE